MGVDMVLAAAKHSISDAAILAGDSDFLPAIDRHGHHASPRGSLGGLLGHLLLNPADLSLQLLGLFHDSAEPFCHRYPPIILPFGAQNELRV
jgi:hypothetical protein